MTMDIFTTGPYIEMSINGRNPMTPQVVSANGEEVVTWRVPLTNEGAVVHLSLDDCAYYVRWLFDHPDQDGIDLEVAIEHIRYADLVAAFEKVTGCKARFVDVTLEQYWSDGPMRKRASTAAGIEANTEESGVLSVKKSFTGFWNMWRNSGGNTGVTKRDYELLDETHPNTIRSVEQFFHVEDEKAKVQGPSLLKYVKTAKSPLQPRKDRN
ncbi:hypothetical protein FBEOM_12290 [Fusarium beomiforme]|uniref:NmrA-like domain-containing protein n=1 Tax=Fusarium beomiforme TaxID=44412 RepID=A0A9P5DQQ7_9HYPO|nr:hypothetical protein FBEOM_12290 [Fusarium beomiforme]